MSLTRTTAIAGLEAMPTLAWARIEYEKSFPHQCVFKSAQGLWLVGHEATLPTLRSPWRGVQQSEFDDEDALMSLMMKYGLRFVGGETRDSG